MSEEPEKSKKPTWRYLDMEALWKSVFSIADVIFKFVAWGILVTTLWAIAGLHDSLALWSLAVGAYVVYYVALFILTARLLFSQPGDMGFALENYRVVRVLSVLASLFLWFALVGQLGALGTIMRELIQSKLGR